MTGVHVENVMFQGVPTPEQSGRKLRSFGRKSSRLGAIFANTPPIWEGFGAWQAGGETPPTWTHICSSEQAFWKKCVHVIAFSALFTGAAQAEGDQFGPLLRAISEGASGCLLYTSPSPRD